MSAIGSRGFGLLSVLAAGLWFAACREDDGPTAASPVEANAVTTASVVFYQVSTADAHTCAITVAGRAYCWGDNFAGKLGDGTTTERDTPTPVAGNLVFRNISAGYNHTCGVTTDFLAYCWGSSLDGRLGTGVPSPHPTPTRVAGGLKFRIVTTGVAYSCGLTEPDQRPYCWGDDRYGELGDGGSKERDTPVPVAGGRRFRQISAGALHTCAVTPTNQAYCWGTDNSGELGDGVAVPVRSKPTLVSGGHLFTQIDAGFFNTCAVNTAGRAYCWGQGLSGDGTNEQRHVPVRVSGTLTYRRVTAGDNHSCGETLTGKAYCWGLDFAGALGDGSSSTRALKPVAVTGGLVFAQLTAGRSTCGKAAGGSLYCWGDNSFGQLGDGTTEARFAPTRVADPQ
jgi:alpha-tubulin suppressor-like RCC1 family protein